METMKNTGHLPDLVQINQMKPEDSEQVCRLFENCFAAPWSLQSIEEMFERPGYYNLVARQDGGIIGYIGILAVLDEADITNVAVHPDHRRRQVGRALLHELLELAGQKGIRHIYLEVRRSNEAAIHLYESAGFSGIDIRKNYYEHPAEDAVIMMR
ncbi:MAG: ribosomal protein S18-alanine N-acetyltransferase [Eubacterium sp.]|nr:ribosomal protein S18-alanine N-acetyltransferase [Eubacterium sp.]